MSLGITRTQRRQSLRNVPDAIEVIPSKFWWVPNPDIVSLVAENVLPFNTDNLFVYEAFSQDFGPLDLGSTIKYCRILKQMMMDPNLKDRVVVHTCSPNYKNLANSICLAGAFLILVQGLSADEAFSKFASFSPRLRGYCDASSYPSPFALSALDVLSGLEFAKKQGWVDVTSFDLQSYEHYRALDNGDISWILPGKILAFAGPSDTGVDENGSRATDTQVYLRQFKRLGVTHIVRLNKIGTYDASKFVNVGIAHQDLFFADGSCPSQAIVEKFLAICSQVVGDDAASLGSRANSGSRLSLPQPTNSGSVSGSGSGSGSGVLAVHCKAGLGRTGTLIGMYLMSRYGISARAFIGWCRLCRPGSVLGPQQDFLCQFEASNRQAVLAQMASRSVSNSSISLKKSISPVRQGQRGAAGAVDPVTGNFDRSPSIDEADKGRLLSLSKTSSKRDSSAREDRMTDVPTSSQGPNFTSQGPSFSSVPSFGSAQQSSDSNMAGGVSFGSLSSVSVPSSPVFAVPDVGQGEMLVKARRASADRAAVTQARNAKAINAFFDYSMCSTVGSQEGADDSQVVSVGGKTATSSGSPKSSAAKPEPEKKGFLAMATGRITRSMKLDGARSDS